ncbi:putative Histidine kinase [Alphaproteobacteria bacterium]
MQSKIIEQIFDAIPANIYWKDLGGRYLGCNIHMALMAGYKSTAEIIGKSDYDLVWKDQASSIIKNDSLVIQENCIIKVEETTKDANNETKKFLTSKVPLYNKNGKSIGIMGVSIDITEQKKQLKELEDTKILVQDLLKIKDSMLANIAHEINNPINSLQFLLILLLEDWEKKSDEEKRTLIQDMIGCTNTLAELTGNIFNISGTANKYENLKLANHDIIVLINDVIQEFKNISIGRTIPEIILESQLEEFHLNIDYQRMKLVIRSILSNAIKHTETLAPIKIIVCTTLNEVEILIKDNGIGVPGSELELIFEPYIVGSNSAHCGIGLGLSICKEIVLAHRGKILARNNSDLGLAISINLPIYLL